MRVPDAPKANSHSRQARTEGHPIRRPVTPKSVGASPVAIMDVGMRIVYAPVQEIEYIAKQNRSKSHGAPILGQTIDAKCLGDKGWIYPEKEAVGHCGL